MIETFRNRKLKRFTSWLLLFITVFFFFLQVLCLSVEPVHADSNDRRRTWIDLAQGKSVTEVSEISDMTVDDLRVVALYLSNFYKTFNTRLNLEASSSDETDNEDYINVRNMMNKALSDYCGFDKDAAEYLVQLSMQCSVNTRTPLYVEKDCFKVAWLLAYNIFGNDYNDSWWNNPPVCSGAEKKSRKSLGFVGDKAIHAKVPETILHISDFNAYCEKLGERTLADGRTYVPLTYPIFMGMMDCVYKIACYDTLENNLDTLIEHINLAGLDNPNSYIRRPDLDGKMYGSTEASCNTLYIPFYWIDENSNEAKVAFGANAECMTMFAMVNNNYKLWKQGYASAFFNMELSEVKKLSGDDIFDCSAFGQRLYTNWVGDILLDNKVDLIPILPGCANPFMVTRITETYKGEEKGEDKYVLGNRLPLINVYGLAAFDDLFESNNDTYCYSSPCSGNLFDLNYWRFSANSGSYNWDHSNWNGFGEPYQTIYDKLKGINCIKGEEGSGGSDDMVEFPSWNHIVHSTSVDSYGESNAPHREGYCRLGGSNYYKSGKKEKHSKYLCGISKVNVNFLYYNNLKGIKEGQGLREYFNGKGDIDSSNILKTYSKLNSSLSLGSYSGINDTSLNFNMSTKSLLQQIFLTYSFAYFNSSCNSYSADENVINLKLQLSRFPNADSLLSGLDWEAIEVSQDKTSEEVLSFVYYLLHPTKGIKYVATWIKNKIAGIFIGWHEDIVGSSDSNSSLGMTQYLGFSGYVTTPNLHDIEWIDSLMNSYNSLIVYILILMAVILLAYIIVGELTIQRAIIGFVMFGFCAFLPPIFMNTTIDIINTTCDSLYSDKFDYWAIVQTEEYLGRLDSYKDAEFSGNANELAAAVILANGSTGGVEGETSYSGMRLKWISPKKFNELADFSNAMNTSSLVNGNGVLQTMVINSIRSNTSGETFSDSSDSLFLYRDILDIYRYGSMSYNVYSSSGGITDATWSNYSLDSAYSFNNSDDSLVNTKWSDPGATTTWTITNSFNNVDDSLLSLFDNTTIKFKINSGNIMVSLTTDYNCLYYRVGCNLSKQYSNTNSLYATSGLQSMRLGFLNNKFGDNLNSATNYYTKDNLSNTLLVLFSKTYKMMGLHEASYNCVNNNLVDLSSTAMNNGWEAFKLRNIFADFPSNFNYSIQNLQGSIDGNYPVDYDSLSAFYYGLYSESPYYFLNYEFRDILRANTSYYYNANNLVSIDETGYNLNNVIELFLKDNQEYFYNYENNDGYGELKDFMNMHDFFYTVIPAMRQGVDLIRKFDRDSDFKTYDTCPLRLQSDGSFKYNSETIISANGSWVSSTTAKDFWSKLNEQQRREFWHDLNVNLLSYYCCSWLDTMYDCDYADSEIIEVMGKKFTVLDPLNPMSYYTVDASGNIVNGRLMVFSRSEMKYYGLSLTDLTTVEQKIIKMQDNVYKKAIQLTNYYNLSDETLIHNYSLLQLFEFNKTFSQETLLGEDYILYPQGYELKATSYDGYLRLILYGSTDEDLMTNDAEGNTSIYQRIMEKTSLFFGLMLIANDFVAVYAIPALKLFFLVLLFFLSIAIIIACAIKIEMNMFTILWKSLFAPMISYAGVSIGLAWVVSLFMSNGSSGVTQDSVIIKLGDPTMVILVMLIINIVALILYWKICKKCFKDFKKYVTAIFHGALGAVSGAIGKIVGSATSGKDNKDGSGGYSTPEQRGADNNPASGKSGVGTALAAGTAGGLVANAVSGDDSSSNSKEEEKTKLYNDKSKVGHSLNEASDKADNDVKINKEKEKHGDAYQAAKEDKAYSKLDAKEKKLNSKKAKDEAKLSSSTKKAYKNRNTNDTGSVLKIQEQKKAKQAKINSKYEKKQGKIMKKAEKATSRREKAANKAKLRTQKASTRASALKSGGINRYKVAAVMSSAAKGTAKASAKVAKGAAKTTAKAVKKTAKTTVKVGTRAAKNTARATVNAAANAMVDKASSARNQSI